MRPAATKLDQAVVGAWNISRLRILPRTYAALPFSRERSLEKSTSDVFAAYLFLMRLFWMGGYLPCNARLARPLLPVCRRVML